jgi:uncharacterized protein YoxC
MAGIEEEDTPMTLAMIISVTFVTMLCGCMLAISLNVLRKVQKLQERLESEVRAMRGEVTAVGRGAVGLGKRVQTLQQRVDATERRQEELEYKDVGDVAITHASKLVQMGADSAELVSTCGLSKAEATLLSLMHARTRPASRSAA